MMVVDMFARWHAAADRVEAALAAHEAALRAADDRRARGAEAGFRARWCDLRREASWLLRDYFAPLGRSIPDSLAVLAGPNPWPAPTAPRVVHDAGTIRFYIARVRMLLDDIERSARGHPPADCVVRTTQAELANAEGRTPKRARYLDQLQADGRIRIVRRARTRGGKSCVEILDPFLWGALTAYREGRE